MLPLFHLNVHTLNTEDGENGWFGCFPRRFAATADAYIHSLLCDHFAHDVVSVDKEAVLVLKRILSATSVVYDSVNRHLQLDATDCSLAHAVVCMSSGQWEQLEESCGEVEMVTTWETTMWETGAGGPATSQLCHLNLHWYDTASGEFAFEPLPCSFVPSVHAYVHTLFEKYFIGTHKNADESSAYSMAFYLKRMLSAESAKYDAQAQTLRVVSGDGWWGEYDGDDEYDADTKKDEDKVVVSLYTLAEAAARMKQGSWVEPNDCSFCVSWQLTSMDVATVDTAM
jgi:hypothetical protein